MFIALLFVHLSSEPDKLRSLVREAIILLFWILRGTGFLSDICGIRLLSSVKRMSEWLISHDSPYLKGRKRTAKIELLKRHFGNSFRTIWLGNMLPHVMNVTGRFIISTMENSPIYILYSYRVISRILMSSIMRSRYLQCSCGNASVYLFGIFNNTSVS